MLLRSASLLFVAAATLFSGCAAVKSPELQTTEHRVPVVSTAPAAKGQRVELYVREIKPAGSGKLPVVVFIHGAGTPAEVSFDSRMEDYSWLKQVARAGFDTFSVSLTGYGRSTRPAPMDQPCNILKTQQSGYVPAPCAPTHPSPIATSTSDWEDMDAVIDHVRRLRGVDRVSLVGWSQGGARISGYVARHPAKIDRIAVLAPAYNLSPYATEPATPIPLPDGSMTVQSKKDFLANWNRQVGCPAQFAEPAADAIFEEMLESDPVGAKWGSGVRRAPVVPIWGFTKELVGQIRTPFLMFAADHDKQVVPQRVHELYADLGSEKKVLVDLSCSSHNAMWEKNRRFLFDATVSWLREGKVYGVDRGTLRMGN